jgi:hypothetical protein
LHHLEILKLKLDENLSLCGIMSQEQVLILKPPKNDER